MNHNLVAVGATRSVSGGAALQDYSIGINQPINQSMMHEHASAATPQTTLPYARAQSHSTTTLHGWRVNESAHLGRARGPDLSLGAGTNSLGSFSPLLQF
jgi:hypothetical protein